MKWACGLGSVYTMVGGLGPTHRELALKNRSEPVGGKPYGCSEQAPNTELEGLIGVRNP